MTQPQFKPDGKDQPTFLLSQHPMRPPSPIAVFAPHSAAMGFDFNYSPDFGPVGDVFVAEFGSEVPGTTGGKPLPQVGHRVSRIELKTGKLKNFAINRSGYAATHTGDGGLERPIDDVFGPSGDLFVLDMGLTPEDGKFIANTGVVWRITRQ